MHRQKIAEFTAATMQARWRQGTRDAQAKLATEPWLHAASEEGGVRIFDLLHNHQVTAA